MQRAGTPKKTALKLNTMMPIEVMEYQWLRFLIGVIAVLFPLVLYIGQKCYLYLYEMVCLHPADYPVVYTSLSAYYRGPMRNVFVGTLTTIGVFLCSYRGRDLSWLPKWLPGWAWVKWLRRSFLTREGALSIGAGLAAVGVAFFPERYAQTVHFHFILAAALFLALARFACLFAEETNSEFRKRFFWLCSAIILAMIVWSGIDHFLDSGSILGQESAAVIAFGVSWLVVSDKVERPIAFIDAGFNKGMSGLVAIARLLRRPPERGSK